MFKHIMLATDGSETSAHAASRAAALAGQLNARLTAVFVSSPFPYLNETEKDRFVSAAREAAEKAFGEISAQIVNGIEFEGVFTEGRSVEERINELVLERGADLLVVGSHGHSGLNRLLLGSVATKLASTCSVPVLIER